ADLTIVKDGQNPLPVIIYKGAPKMTRESADHLALYIGMVSGVKPQVIEGEPAEIPEQAIWVGVQPKVKELFADLDLDFKNPEEIIISANDKHLLIAGRDRWHKDGLAIKDKRGKKNIEGIQQEYGTANAVYTFIQDYLDVRWLWPGETGIDIIEKKTISFAPFTYQYHPQIRARAGVFVFSGFPKGGYGRSMEWTKLQRLSLCSLNFPGGHAFTHWWERFHKTNPEYFALQPDGKRSGFPGARTVKLCRNSG
ncbi:MAG: hypothetical protein ACYTFY_22810, partial [Planctomycetota bacterium]